MLAPPSGAALASAARADVDRALDALVENALRYAPEGSTVELRAVGDTIEVLDEGPGIAPDEAEAVFERFHRGAAGRRAPGGTGLGLTIARTLARRWAGDVTIANRIEGGARAVLRLPRVGSSRDEAAACGRRRLRRRFAGGALASMTMRTRSLLAWIAAGLIGLALAAGVTYAATQLSSQRIGLSAEPPSAGEELAPRGQHAAPRVVTTTRTRTSDAAAPDEGRAEHGSRGDGAEQPREGGGDRDD